MKNECCGSRYIKLFVCLLLAAVVSLSGCTNPEKAKAEHLKRGEAYLKDFKFQEATLEFRSALQYDEKLAAAHWGLARAYEELQRFPEMITELHKTLELDKGHLDARIKLGNYSLAASKGKPELLGEAERLAREVLEREPNNIEGHILMGSVLFNRNEKDKAFAELNRAVELDPKRVESYLSLARFLVVTGERDKAEELLKKAISIKGNSALAHTQYGMFLVQGNRLGEAEAELTKAVEVEPTDRDARRVLAGFYLVNRQLDKAEAAFKSLAALDSDKPQSQLIVADFYSAVNRMDEAIKIYKDVLAKAPDYMQGRYRLAEILLLRGDTEGANAQIEEALKKDPHDRQALLLRARVRTKGWQPEGVKAAIEDLNEVLRQEPNSRYALYLMAEANFSLERMDQARAFIGELEKNYPDYLPAKLMQVNLNLFGSEYNPANYKTAISLATDLLNRLSKVAPDRQDSAQWLGQITEKTLIARGTAHLQLKNLTAARQDFESAKQIAPGDPTVYNSLALVSLGENKRDDAIAEFENALRVDATNFKALNGLLTLYIRNQEIDKANSRLDQVLSSYPNNASLHFLKGQLYRGQGNIQGAEAELRKTLELDGNYIAAYTALAQIFLSSKQEDRAIAEYKKILAVRPDNAAVYTLIGILEYARNNTDAAVENYRKALEKDQNAVYAANNLAWIYAEYGKGNLDEAVRMAQGVVQKHPNIAGFLDTLGWVYYKKQLYPAAADQLQKAVALDEAAARAAQTSPSATYYYHLGMALKGKGDKEGSRRALETALRLADKNHFPDAEEARKALASL
jgi:tetratricopeptide (TPR) repeat protein